jgi:hypothetical protein
MEGIRSSEMSVLITATRRYIPEDAILHSLRREDLKSYNYERQLQLLISSMRKVLNEMEAEIHFDSDW